MPTVTEQNGVRTTIYESGTVVHECSSDLQPAPPAPRWITPGALRDRMGDQKFPILASQDPEIKALLYDIADRHYIDLDHPELLPGLQLVQSKGFTIDPAAIVGAEIQDIERP